MRKLLVANRGEIAVRIMEGAAVLGIPTVAVYPADDVASGHVGKATERHELAGSGPSAYTDIPGLLEAAERTGCDAVHPGYGFLSESPEFAGRCRAAGLTFVGPRTELLEIFGDKSTARAQAERAGVAVLAGTEGPTELAEAEEFLHRLGPGGAVMVKAIGGGGGRGIRPVRDPAELPAAFEQCRAESLRAGGDGSLFVEELMPRSLHIEVQLVGDAAGNLVHLGERDCTIQRRRQKLLEIAPSPALDPATRETILRAAVAIGQTVGYDSLGTVEFLVDAAQRDAGSIRFLELNPRIQVEHPVTEQVTGLDLVTVQLRLAAGATLTELGLDQARVPAARGVAIEARVNAERMAADGTVTPVTGTASTFRLPSGPGVRVDTHAYPGFTANPRYDSLLAKIITHGADPDLAAAAARAARAMRSFDPGDIETNAPILAAVLDHPAFRAGQFDTGFVDTNLADLLTDQPARHSAEPGAALPAGSTPVIAEMSGVVVDVPAALDDELLASDAVVVVEAMKMEHVISAGRTGRLREIRVHKGDSVAQGDILAVLEESDEVHAGHTTTAEVDLDQIRPDLAEVHERHRVGLDEARPEAVARRHAASQRTARENIADLCDPDSFVEYGALTLAAQRRRRSVAELIERTPADGLVSGIGSVNAAEFGAESTRCVVMSYDYTVLAGTQGLQNHRKMDRMFQLAARERLPVVLFAEGGGGRPGDTDTTAVSSLDVPTFGLLGKLSGSVPLIAIVSGRCFAGNAALAGCCDVLIATEDANLGMGGPAMIEGGGLGRFAPEEIGPMSVQAPNGVVDVQVTDEAEAVGVARKYLSYFQGPLGGWQQHDQRMLRHAVPENRLRVYDVRTVLETLADAHSVLELRRDFGTGMITALARIEGHPVGVLANNPRHLGGAIDAEAADKAARFFQLCEAFGLPVVSLCDTPGFMVGPDAERTATVRHFSRMFVAGANMTVPMCTVVLRKGYGLGAMAMAGGHLKAPLSTVSWPTGEFGGMGLEGAVRLGYRAELDAIADPEERRERYEELVAEMYAQGKAISTAAAFEIDDVIDPAQTRQHLSRLLGTAPPRPAPRLTFVDTW